MRGVPRDALGPFDVSMCIRFSKVAPARYGAGAPACGRAQDGAVDHPTSDVGCSRIEDLEWSNDFMGNCIVVVQFDLPKRTEEQAVKGVRRLPPSTAVLLRRSDPKGLPQWRWRDRGRLPLGEPRFRRGMVHRGSHD